MKRTLLIILFSFLSCFVGAAEVLDFEFTDGAGKIFRTTTFIDQLEQIYRNRYEDMGILLIETPSLNHQLYRKQDEILKSMDHSESEKLGLIYVISCWKYEEYIHGYHTSIKTTESLAGVHKSFRITLLDGKGRPYFRNNDPISLKMLRDVIKNRDK